MYTHVIWIIVLSISAPVAGVVGFALQLRQVKKVRLENVKLQLEIDALKKLAAESNRRIQKPSTEEVMRINSGRVMYSRMRTSDYVSAPTRRYRYKEMVVSVSIILFSTLVVSYGVYDLYRLILWFLSNR